jgi:hypothetical protein
MLAAGLADVTPFNPHRALHGRTFPDHDSYCVVLQHAQWTLFRISASADGLALD